MDLIRKESSQKGQTKDSESSGNPGGVDYVIERRRVMITQSGYVALTSLLGFVLVARRRKSPPASTCARAGGDFACDHEPQAAEESSHHRGEATRQRRDPAGEGSRQPEFHARHGDPGSTGRALPGCFRTGGADAAVSGPMVTNFKAGYELPSAPEISSRNRARTNGKFYRYQ
jgi:hypothetical protein